MVSFLSAFYWLPVVLESTYTHQPTYAKILNYAQISQLLFSPWRYGLLFQGPTGELSYVIGYVQLLIICISLYKLFRKKLNSVDTDYASFFIIFFFIFCFMMLPVSAPVWNTITILRNFQFTYRFLLLIAVCTSFLAGLLTKYLNYKVMLTLCFLAVLSTSLNWGNRGTMPWVTEETIFKNVPLHTYQAEGLAPAAPKWVNIKEPWQKEIPAKHMEIIKGSATVKEISRTPIVHKYSITVHTKTEFRENTTYFPNWIVYVNEKPVNITYTKKEYPGIITFILPKGKYDVRVIFQPTMIRTVAEWISIVSVVVFIIFTIWLNRKPKINILNIIKININ